MNLNNKICTKPWEYIEFHLDYTNNDIFMIPCCPSWLNINYGYINENFKFPECLDTLHNKNANLLKQSILDGSYKYCNKDLCPYIQSNDLSIKGKNIDNLKLRHINLCYDRTCNLKCPSCRKNYEALTIDSNPSLYNKAKKLQNNLLNYINSIDYEITLALIGSGDPFASELCLDFIRNINNSKINILFQTNGLLFTEKMWKSLKNIYNNNINMMISLDAANEEEYNLIRCGGSWDKIMNNLSFISSLKKNNNIKSVILCCVVQNLNYKSIPNFIKIAKKFDFTAHFSRLVNWGTFSDKEFKEHNIFDENHPNHQSFINIINQNYDYKHIAWTNLDKYIEWNNLEKYNNMITLENIVLYFIKCGERYEIYSDRLEELFPWSPPWRNNATLKIKNDSKYTARFNNFKEDLCFDELYLLSDMGEGTFGIGVLNFISRILTYPKNKKILATNKLSYMDELYFYFKKEGYDFFSKDEIDGIINKRIIVKKLYIGGENYYYNYSTRHHDFSEVNRNIHNDNLVIFRQDAADGRSRKLINYTDVYNLFKKYNFDIIPSLSVLSFNQRKVLMNSYKNIFVEGGCALASLFLIDNFDISFYIFQSPSLDSKFDLVFDENLKINYLDDVCYFDTENDLIKEYKQKLLSDPQNVNPENIPFLINIEKLDSVIKNLI